MHEMSEASDEKLDEYNEVCQQTIKKVINRQNAKISVTSTTYADVSGLVDPPA